MESKIAEWRRSNAGADQGERERAAATAALGQAIAEYLPQQKAQIELSAINDGLLKAAAPTPADLPLLGFPLRRSLFTLEALASEVDPVAPACWSGRAVQADDRRRRQHPAGARSWPTPRACSSDLAIAREHLAIGVDPQQVAGADLAEMAAVGIDQKLAAVVGQRQAEVVVDALMKAEPDGEAEGRRQLDPANELGIVHRSLSVRGHAWRKV